MPSAPVNSSLPRISIVTPSFNQGAFLEDTLRSVLDQNYPNLEYVVVDGGSTDGSVEIIRRYQDRLTWWVSEPDAGQYDAINKGFLHTQGEIMGWLNADDKYLPWTFAVIAELMGKPRTTSNGQCDNVTLTAPPPSIEWLTSLFPLFWDGQGRAVHCEAHEGYSRQLVLRGGTLPGCGWAAWTFLQQEATFWRRSLWDRAGGQVNPAYSLAADYDLWMRFARQAEIYCAAVPLGGFRRHPAQKTGSHMKEYVRQARESFVRHGGRPPGKLQSFCLKNVGKLLRYFQRRQTFACTQQGFSNRCVFADTSGRWQLRRY